MGRSRELVEPFHLTDREAGLEQRGQIPTQGLRLAGEQQDARDARAGERARDRLTEPGPGRIGHEEIGVLCQLPLDHLFHRGLDRPDPAVRSPSHPRQCPCADRVPFDRRHPLEAIGQERGERPAARVPLDDAASLPRHLGGPGEHRLGGLRIDLEEAPGPDAQVLAGQGFREIRFADRVTDLALQERVAGCSAEHLHAGDRAISGRQDGVRELDGHRHGLLVGRQEAHDPSLGATRPSHRVAQPRRGLVADPHPQRIGLVDHSLEPLIETGTQDWAHFIIDHLVRSGHEAPEEDLRAPATEDLGRAVAVAEERAGAPDHGKSVPEGMNPLEGLADPLLLEQALGVRVDGEERTARAPELVAAAVGDPAWICLQNALDPPLKGAAGLAVDPQRHLLPRMGLGDQDGALSEGGSPPAIPVPIDDPDLHLFPDSSLVGRIRRGPPLRRPDFRPNSTMSKTNIAILTGGGDAPGLNAVIRAVVKHGVTVKGWQVFGIEDSFNGLIESPSRIRELGREDVRGILRLGGTVLGTTNHGDPFHWAPEGTTRDLSGHVASGLKDLGCEGLIVVGGDGTMRIAARLAHEHGVKVIGVPKTIDNDIPGTEMTFGFDTAMSFATEAVDRLHATAEAHDRVMVVEVMGRDAGHIALGAGVAGGADVILMPEIPFKWEPVLGKIRRRAAYHRHFSVVVVAEGAAPAGQEQVTTSVAGGGSRLGGVGQLVTEQLAEMAGMDARCTVLGHLQRGGTPTAFDRVLATRMGSAAVEMAEAGNWGQVVAIRDGKMSSVPLDSMLDSKPRTVDINGDLMRAARGMSIVFGDEES